MTYVSKFFLHPPSLEEEEIKAIENFLNRELPVPRETFGAEVIPIIYRFVIENYPNGRCFIYMAGSEG